jgi:hypothetical protein
MGSCPAIAAKVETVELSIPANDMPVERIAELLAKKKIINQFFDKLEKHAVTLLEDGHILVPGLKLVNKFGRRSWAIGEDDLIKACRNRKVGKKQLFESKLKSPAQLEKIMGKPFVRERTKTEISGVTVALESDKRPGVDVQSVRNEFRIETQEQ